jgi:hypothetical protein
MTGQDMNKLRNAKLSPEERSRIASIAGKVGGKKRWENKSEVARKQFMKKIRESAASANRGAAKNGVSRARRTPAQLVAESLSVLRYLVEHGATKRESAIAAQTVIKAMPDIRAGHYLYETRREGATANGRVDGQRNAFYVTLKGRKLLGSLSVIGYLVEHGATNSGTAIAAQSVIKAMPDIRAGHCLYETRREGTTANGQVEGVRNAFYVTAAGQKLIGWNRASRA